MRRALVACTLAFALFGSCRQLTAQDSASDYFEKNVRPILTQRCAPCHTTKSKGGLKVDSAESLIAGGDSGPSIVPGDPEKSLLIGALRWTDAQLNMPPKKRLDPAQIDKVVEWIRRAGPKARPAEPTPATPKPATPAAPVAPVTTRDAVGVDAKTLYATGQNAEKAGAASDLEAAVAAYGKLVQSFPNDAVVPRAYLHLGLCLVKLDKTEEAREALRRAHRLGKADPEVVSSAENALISLPPPPEPKAQAPAQAPAVPPPAPAAKPEAPRSPAQIEIDNLEAEKRELVKKAQDLEDAGKIAEAYRVRAKIDEKIALIEKKRKEMKGGR